ncbi:MAG TPA: trypsin-like peptidase domain-containing protein [Blastocatellia bacterium]|nr:trypsin-like peptidase domain-containing protein [Blastocatellia bacterium]
MRTYQITAKQLVVLSLITALFASGAVVMYDRLGSEWLGRLVGAKTDKAVETTATIAGLTDPSVATDEKNNQEVYTAISPGVVNITSTVLVEDWFNVYPKQGTGSGSILDKEGRILTNYHVIQDAEKLDVKLSNNKSYEAKVVGADPDNDLAVIQINAPAAELSIVPFGTAKNLFVGQKVLAIGNPFGLDRTLTTGIISGLSRPIRSEMTQRLIEGVIQTDAAINPGNSGGPLLNSHGQLIGINTMIYSPSGGSVGIGFAVPVETAIRVISDIKQYGRVRKPQPGVNFIPLANLGERFIRAVEIPVSEGLMVVEVQSGSSAERAGIQGPTQAVRYGRYQIPIGGDIIIGMDGQKIATRDDYDRVLNTKNVGDRVQVEVMRNGRKVALTLTLDEGPRSSRSRI